LLAESEPHLVDPSWKKLEKAPAKRQKKKDQEPGKKEKPKTKEK